MILNLAGRPVTSRKRLIPVVDHRLFEYLSWGDPMLPTHGLTVCCQRCGGTTKGANHDHDDVWVMECDCTKWEWRRRAERTS